MAKAMVPDGEANKILMAAWGLDCVDLNDKCKETVRWFGIFESIARCGEIPPRQRWCVRWELEKQCCAWCGAVGASDIGRKKEGGWRWLKGVKFAEFLWEPWEAPMKTGTVHICIAQALRVALLRAPPNTFFEDTFMWSGEDTFPAAEFPSATELPREDVFRRHFSRSRISPRHRITSRRRFSKTLFPQPNFSPPPNCPPKTLFEDTFPAAEFLSATELPTEDAFRRHFFPQPNLRPPPNCPFRGENE